jgi:hypothetical protein
MCQLQEWNGRIPGASPHTLHHLVQMLDVVSAHLATKLIKLGVSSGTFVPRGKDILLLRPKWRRLSILSIRFQSAKRHLSTYQLNHRASCRSKSTLLLLFSSYLVLVKLQRRIIIPRSSRIYGPIPTVLPETTRADLRHVRVCPFKAPT